MSTMSKENDPYGAWPLVVFLRCLLAFAVVVVAAVQFDAAMTKWSVVELARTQAKAEAAKLKQQAGCRNE